MPSLASHKDRPYRIAIVGGGLMGATLAAFLAPSQAEIYVLDKQTRATAYQSTHVIALSAGACACYAQWLQSVAFENFGTQIRRVETTTRQGVGKITFNAADLNVDYLGLVIPVVSLLQILHQTLDAFPHCHWLESAACQTVQSSDAGVELRYGVGSSEPQTLQVDLCLIADGMQSPLAQQLGFGTAVHPYHQHAIVGECKLALPHQGTAYERFLDTGALALLPFGERGFWYVLVVDEAKTQSWLSLKDTDFLAQLNDLMAYRAGLLTQVVSRHAVPLSQSLAQAIIGNRCLVMGNAAHSLHPLAAQGFNLSVMDAHQLALLFQETQATTDTTQTLLQAYQQRTTDYQKTLIQAVHGLAMLGTQAWLAPLKSLGLTCMGHLPSVQTSIADLSLGRY